MKEIKKRNFNINEKTKELIDYDKYFVDGTDVGSNDRPASLESQIATEYVQDFDYDLKLTNDFDYRQEKPLKGSTLKKMYSDLQNAIWNESTYVANFDKLKMAIDTSFPNLNFRYSSYNMIECKNPSKIQYNSKLTLLEQFDESENFSEDIPNIQQKGTVKFPNCQICKEIYNKTVGILNIYIQNGILYICLSGKFMASKGYLGGINKNNIKKCLEKVIRLDLVYFSIDVFLENALVYSCDEFIDVQVGTLDAVRKYIRALSAFLPLCSNMHNLSKYLKESLFLKKKAKRVGSSFLIYNKFAEIKDGRNSKTKTDIYACAIEDNEFLLAKGIIRFETKMYTLADIRRLLNIPQKDAQKVYLKDVLDSKSKCALIMMEVFSADLETLKNKISGYMEIHCNERITKNTLLYKLASQMVAKLLQENDNDLVIVKNTLITEFGIENESLINQLITELKNVYFDFLIYKKPRSIKKVIELIGLINKAYEENNYVIS